MIPDQICIPGFEGALVILKIPPDANGSNKISCSKNDKVSIVKEKNIETQMTEAFEEGYTELENGDVLFAAKKFNEAEILFPQSIWAPKSALMAAYSYYTQDYYGDAVAELER